MMMMMKIVVLICAIAGPLSLPPAAASVAHLEEVCKEISGPTYVPPDFCKAFLLTDPRSRDADDRALGGISVDVLIGNATALRAELEALWRKEGNESSRALLRACAKIYGDKSDFLETAKEAAKDGYFGTAGVNCGEFLLARFECERIFDANEIENPVKEHIGLLYIATDLTKALNDRLGNPSKS